VPYADLPEVRLHYVLEGPPDAPVVMLSNSLGTDLSMWDAVAAVLSRRMRVLRYDTRGHGRSGAAVGGCTLADLGRDALALLDELGLKQVSFCGLSIGGMTGMWLAAHTPERVDRLVLCCTSAHMAPAQAWRDRAAAVRQGGMIAVADTVIARWFTPPFAAEHPQEYERIRRVLLDTDPEGYAACCEALAVMDQRADLAAITAPTLVVAGGQDAAAPPEHARQLADGIDGAHLLLLPDAAHIAAVERPEEVTSAVLRHLGERLPGDRYADGMAVRREVLGAEYVDRATAAAGPLRGQFQELITRYAWGEIWTRPGLDRHTRSCITVAMLVALDKWEELALHLAAARRNGVTDAELVEVLLQTAIYAGVPAANSAFAVLDRVLGGDPDGTALP
jgi:3-oxoadipate enol-lactonase/4-carboxymuconolactone decarboxylase